MESTATWDHQPGRHELAAHDRELIARVAAGDRAALAALYEEHRRPLVAYLMTLTADRGQAEEILQDTLVAVWRHAHTFRGRSTLRTWLLGVARRQAHNALRRGGRLAPTPGEAALQPLVAADPDPADVAIARATAVEIDAALDRLTPLHREALVLAFVHDLSYREMALVLDVPLGTVKSRLSNAKRALRPLLEAEQGGTP